MTSVENTPKIGSLLESLEERDRIFGWRLWTLQRAGYNVGPAIRIARSGADLHRAVKMFEDGCPDHLVAEILD